MLPCWPNSFPPVSAGHNVEVRQKHAQSASIEVSSRYICHASDALMTLLPTLTFVDSNARGKHRTGPVSYLHL